MDLRINRCKKFITWNIISLLGYIGIIFGIIFCVMYIVSSSGIGISADISKIYYVHMVKHVILPYIELYKYQLFIVGIMLILSVYENSYYIQTEKYGLRLFADNEIAYSKLFVTGVCFNIIPMYILFVTFISKLLKIIF